MMQLFWRHEGLFFQCWNIEKLCSGIAEEVLDSLRPPPDRRPMKQAMVLAKRVLIFGWNVTSLTMYIQEWERTQKPSPLQLKKTFKPLPAKLRMIVFIKVLAVGLIISNAECINVEKEKSGDSNQDSDDIWSDSLWVLDHSWVMQRILNDTFSVFFRFVGPDRWEYDHQGTPTKIKSKNLATN